MWAIRHLQVEFKVLYATVPTSQQGAMHLRHEKLGYLTYIASLAEVTSLFASFRWEPTPLSLGTIKLLCICHFCRCGTPRSQGSTTVPLDGCKPQEGTWNDPFTLASFLLAQVSLHLGKHSLPPLHSRSRSPLSSLATATAMATTTTIFLLPIPLVKKLFPIPYRPD